MSCSGHACHHILILGCWFAWLDQKYCPSGIYGMYWICEILSITRNFETKMKIYSPKQKGQGYAFEFLWNLIKVMLWIYLWGGSTCPHLLGFMFGNENYQKVSSSWCQLVFFNKMIANLHIVRTLLTNLHTKNPYDVKSAMKCHFFFVHVTKSIWEIVSIVTCLM
jgi:hypothetical protein